jgi:hypothetical protein
MKEKTMFPLGKTKATPLALDVMKKAVTSPVELLNRHMRGDWGDIHPCETGLNEQALNSGGRIVSVYHLVTGETIWIITERDRSATTLLLPEEY